MPTRVVSLLPSATELICSVLDQHEQDVIENENEADDASAILVGRSHECDYPEKASKLPALTASTIRFSTSADVDKQVRDHLATGNGLYSVDSALLFQLAPDVIVTQSLCKVCSVDFCAVEKLAFNMPMKPVLVDTNPQDLFEVLEDLVRIGKSLGMEKAALRARRGFERRIEQVKSYVDRCCDGEDRDSPSVAMMEWIDPIFIGGHWTPQIIHMAGGTHRLNVPKKDGSAQVLGADPSFTVSPEELVACNPDVIIIAPCGLDMSSTMKETRPLFQKPWWPRLKAVQTGNVWLVDGNHMFNRPSTRLVDALEWLCWIFHGMESDGASSFPATKISTTFSF